MSVSINYYYHTVKHLKWRQIYYRLWYRFKKIRVKKEFSLSLRSQTKPFISPVVKKTCLSNNIASFLNHTVNIAKKECWQDPAQEKLWLYHLHYFDDLVSSPGPAQKIYLQNLISRWICENPPISGEGWEAYPLSLRIVNWVKWHLIEHALDEKGLQNLALQADVLSKKIEWHLLGNHLIANAKALIFAGLFFQGREAERWLQKGMRILMREIPEQILNDGGHFERSPMYHAIILEDLLDLYNLCHTYHQAIPHIWHEKIKKMFSWLQIMLHPDKKIAFFNDCAFDVSADFHDLVAYAERLKLSMETSSIAAVTHLHASGYCRLQNQEATLLCDVGDIGPDYLPGHAHADTLSFEFSLGKRRIFVNSGTSTYQNGQTRLHQRSSAAHNTVTVSGKNSSQVWNSFRVAQRAYVQSVDLKETPTQLTLSARHTGYIRLQEKAQHRRTWTLYPKSCQIQDGVEGLGHTAVFAYYHLHPDYEFAPKTERKLQILEKKSQKIVAELSVSDTFSIIPSTYHPTFGVSMPNQCLRLGKSTDLPVIFSWILTWN